MSTLIEEPRTQETAAPDAAASPYAIVADPQLKQRLIAERQEAGSDRWDEVWEGTYILMPLPNDEHQGLVQRISTILDTIIGIPGLGRVRPGVNISDRIEGWKQNYRCPDVVVFLNETQAQNHDTFWYGGPDFAVEVVSPNDRSREKLPFYASIGVRELLLIEREPWLLELFRLTENELKSVGRSTADSVTELKSEIVPLSFALKPAEGRPQIEIRHRDGRQSWSV